MIIAFVLFVFLMVLGITLTRRQRGVNPAFGKPEGEIRMVDPKELLFSLPTINDGLPEVDTSASFSSEPHAALMHEDDWRQDEFVFVAARRFVQETLSQIQSHKAVHAHGIGFREVFMRPEARVALSTAGIRLTDLRAALADTPPTPLYFQSSRPSRVRAGFTFPLPDVGFVYGCENGGVVSALGLALSGSGTGDVTPLAALTSRFQLLFVDWVGGVVIEPGDEGGFRAWLTAIRSAS